VRGSGPAARERVIVVGTDRRETGSLLAAVRRQGVDSCGAERSGQPLVLNKQRLAGPCAKSEREVATNLAHRDGAPGWSRPQGWA
jgi:hypothetical protein